ncbi:hypothetical protein ACFVHW_35210 [Streptomyces sp. NPDC127110]
MSSVEGVEESRAEFRGRLRAHGLRRIRRSIVAERILGLPKEVRA